MKNIEVSMEEQGGWDNIKEVAKYEGMLCICFGDGSPFSDE